MKKAYTKPEIIFDDFSLATTIAAGCAKPTGPHENSCGIEYRPGLILFTAEPICNTTSPDGSDGFCYHVPQPDTKLFNSL